jgi:hypothetical protein
MPHQPGPCFDKLELHTLQGPFLDGLRQRQPPQEVAPVVGQDEKLPPHLVGHTPMTRQPRPLQRVLPLLHPRLGYPPPFVKGHHSLRLGPKVGDEKAYPGKAPPWCHSTCATTRRGRSQLAAWYQKS